MNRIPCGETIFDAERRNLRISTWFSVFLNFESRVPAWGNWNPAESKVCGLNDFSRILPSTRTPTSPPEWQIESTLNVASLESSCSFSIVVHTKSSGTTKPFFSNDLAKLKFPSPTSNKRPRLCQKLTQKFECLAFKLISHIFVLVLF